MRTSSRTRSHQVRSRNFLLPSGHVAQGNASIASGPHCSNLSCKAPVHLPLVHFFTLNIHFFHFRARHGRGAGLTRAAPTGGAWASLQGWRCRGTWVWTRLGHFPSPERDLLFGVWPLCLLHPHLQACGPSPLPWPGLCRPHYASAAPRAARLTGMLCGMAREPKSPKT